MFLDALHCLTFSVSYASCFVVGIIRKYNAGSQSCRHYKCWDVRYWYQTSKCQSPVYAIKVFFIALTLLFKLEALAIGPWSPVYKRICEKMKCTRKGNMQNSGALVSQVVSAGHVRQIKLKQIKMSKSVF